MGLSVGVVVVSSLMLLSWAAAPIAAFNITQMLNAYPSLSSYNQQLTMTGVADEVNKRSSITVLVVSNAVLTSFLASYPNAGQSQVADLLRYNVLLQYLDIPELQTITPGNPSTVTTLYQATGRAAGNSGSVNIYNTGTEIQIGQADVNTPPNSTITGNVTQMPYNISILQCDSVLAPTGFGSAVTGANITAVLETAQNFNTFIGLLQSTGVDTIFANRETGAGITVFAPTDAAFAALPNGALALVTPAQKKLIVEYHALTSYYTLGSLTTLNNPLTPTVATSDSGAGTYLLNITSASTTSGVLLSSGLSTATVGATLFDTPPTVLFSIDAILLPPAIFAAAPSPAPSLGPAPAPAPINGSVPVPAPAPLTPTPAPSPLSPSPTPSLTPTPTPTPTPSPTPSLTPTPALAPGPAVALPPGPPAPPGVGGEPSLSPEGSPGSSSASSTSSSLVVIAVMFLVYAVAML